MYRADNQPDLPDFYLPFDRKLNADNCWVRLAKIIP